VKFHVDARIVPGTDPAPERAAEYARVAELRAEGVIEILIKRTDDTGAYLVMEAPDESALQAAIDSLPYARSGIMRFAVDAVEIL
jgi:muconolactone delta-isomerase